MSFLCGVTESVFAAFENMAEALATASSDASSPCSVKKWRTYSACVAATRMMHPRGLGVETRLEVARVVAADELERHVTGRDSRGRCHRVGRSGSRRRRRLLSVAAMANPKPAWSSMLPGRLPLATYTLDELRSARAAHAFLTEEVKGPPEFGECLRSFRFLLFFGLACIAENKHPPLTRCWKDRSFAFE